MIDKLVELARAVRRLDRWAERPGFGMESDPLGEWGKRADVLRAVDDALREGTTPANP